MNTKCKHQKIDRNRKTIIAVIVCKWFSQLYRSPLFCRQFLYCIVSGECEYIENYVVFILISIDSAITQLKAHQFILLLVVITLLSHFVTAPAFKHVLLCVVYNIIKWHSIIDYNSIVIHISSAFPFRIHVIQSVRFQFSKQNVLLLL